MSPFDAVRDDRGALEPPTCDQANAVRPDTCEFHSSSGRGTLNRPLLNRTDPRAVPCWRTRTSAEKRPVIPVVLRVSMVMVPAVMVSVVVNGATPGFSRSRNVKEHGPGIGSQLAVVMVPGALRSRQGPRLPGATSQLPPLSYSAHASSHHGPACYVVGAGRGKVTHSGTAWMPWRPTPSEPERLFPQHIRLP